jgi:hypothetical protein
MRRLLMSASPASCEVTLAHSGAPCGVAAIGRCNACEEAFCATHQARDLGMNDVISKSYTDWSAACQAEQKAARQISQVEWREAYQRIARCSPLSGYVYM